MLGNEAQAAVQTTLLAAASAAATVNATSAWIDVRGYEGDLLFNVNTGAVTAGSITWTIEDATDGTGTGLAGVTPNEGAFTAVTTANDPLSQKRTVNAGAVRGWVRVLGTIVTGPALCSADLLARPKNS